VSTLPLFLGAGALLGLLHFALLRWTVDRLGQRRGTALAIGAAALRLAATAAGLATVARAGALALLLATLGLVLARHAVVHWPRERTP
jgi:F1F0 ATPase subunit 2